MVHVFTVSDLELLSSDIFLNESTAPQHLRALLPFEFDSYSELRIMLIG